MPSSQVYKAASSYGIVQTPRYCSPLVLKYSSLLSSFQVIKFAICSYLERHSPSMTERQTILKTAGEMCVPMCVVQIVRWMSCYVLYIIIECYAFSGASHTATHPHQSVVPPAPASQSANPPPPVTSSVAQPAHQPSFFYPMSQFSAPLSTSAYDHPSPTWYANIFTSFVEDPASANHERIR